MSAHDLQRQAHRSLVSQPASLALGLEVLTRVRSEDDGGRSRRAASAP
jgi:hypothetical protein